MGWLGGLVASGMGRVAGGAMSIVGGVGSRLLSMLSNGFLQVLGTLGNSLSAVLRFTLSLPRTILNGLGRLSESVVGALSQAARALSGLLAGAAKVGIAGLAVVIGGLVAVVGKAVQTLTAQARGINGLAAATGLSRGQAGGVMSRFRSFGVDAEGMFENENPTMFGMKAGLFGVGNYTNKNFLPQLATQYQGMQASGPLGQMMGRQMLASLGMDNRDGRRLASLAPDDIRKQQSFTSRTQGALGISDEGIARIGQQWDLLTQRGQTFINLVLVKIAGELLPYLNNALDSVLNFAQQYAGGIGGLIEKGVQLFIQGITTAWTALVALGNFLYTTLPRAVLGMAEMFITGLLAMTKAIPVLWETFLTGLSILQSIVTPFIDGLISGFEAARNAVPGLFDTFLTGVDMVQAGLMTVQQLAPIVFQKIEEGLTAIWNSSLVQKLAQALPDVPGAAQTALDVTAPGRGVGRALGGAVGGKSGELAGEYFGAQAQISLMLAGAVSAASSGWRWRKCLGALRKICQKPSYIRDCCGLDWL